MDQLRQNVYDGQLTLRVGVSEVVIWHQKMTAWMLRPCKLGGGGWVQVQLAQYPRSG